MTLPGQARRVFRWKPQSYPQVWLLAAASGLVSGAVVALWLGDLGRAVMTAAVCLFSLGAGQSCRLSQRRDAATVAEWVRSRRLSSGRGPAR